MIVYIHDDAFETSGMQEIQKHEKNEMEVENETR